MSDFKEWAMARKAQGPNGEAASGIQTSVSNPRPPAAQASGPTPFKEWAMQRKAQSLTGRERIVQPYQQTNAGQTARKNAARPQITTPYTVHLDQVNTPQEQFDTAVRRLKTLYQHQNDLASRSATMDPAEYSRQWNETQKQVGQMEALKTSAANQRYRQKNEAALAQINADASLSSDYRSTENIQSDLDKITAIADDAMNHNGGAEIVEYKTELAEKYGLTQQAIDNYAIGGADYHPAGSGITNLWQLYEQLDAQRQEKVKSLQDRGYDYERLQAYKKEKRDAGEYAVQSRQWQQYAEEHPRLASLETTLVSPFQGIDFAKAAVQGIRHGNPEDEENYVPPNLYNMDATNFVSQVRGQVSKNLGEKYDLEIFDQNVAQFLYHTGMSIADSALLIATMGSGAGLLMGTSAAANGTRDAVERGASSSQAILTGLAQGAAELIFEKFSIDQLLKPKSVQSVRRLLQETLKQAGVEASEEGATEIANILTDAAIMGESSNFSISVENYKAQGMSESEARKQAYLDMIDQVGWAAAGGALSGGVMGGFVNTARLGLGNQTENTAAPGTDRQGQARQKMAQPNVIQSNSGMPWAESDTTQSAAAPAAPSSSFLETGSLFPAAVRAAATGQRDVVGRLAREKRAAQYAKVAGSDSGLVYDDFVRQAVESGRVIRDKDGKSRVYLTAQTAEKVNSVAKSLGVRVRFVDSVREGTANAEIHGSDILVERNNENPVLFLLGHEVTHRIQELAPKQYRAFRLAVEGEVREEAHALLGQYRAAGVNLRYEEALDEASANYAGRLIEGGKVLDDFIEKHRDDRTLLEKVRDAIRALLARLTGSERKQARTAEGKLTAALEAAARQAESLQSKPGDDTMSQTKYSVKYWRPDLNAAEWDLLNRHMQREISDNAHTLDEDTKWVYANEKGVQVFGLYGIGDGTEATVLYAVGGKKAHAAYKLLMSEMEGIENGINGNGEGLSQWINSIWSNPKYGRRNSDASGRAGTSSNEINKLHGGASGGKAEGIAGTGDRNDKVKPRFSLKSPVEESGDLIALHNLTEQNLLDALRLGGMPMPSIAVTKVNLPHLEFGDITLVLDKNSIDPGADSRNRVYGADIGSPTAPEEAQTLEEIVEAMKQSRRLPEGVGAMSLQAAVAPSYESLQQLWQDSGRLGRMEGPEFQADLEAVNRQIEEILRQVRQGQVDAEAADAAVALRNAAGSTKTEQAIAQSFAEDGYALDSKLVAQIQAAFQAAVELPTEYFEAKPERVVGFDEVLAAVVPDDSSRELLAGLDAVGVQTLKYRAGDDADRVEQVNSVQQARFSPGSAQKRTRRTNSDSGVIWAGSDTSQSASRPAPLRRSQSNSSSGVLWRGSETAMDSPAEAVYNEAGKGQSTSSSNSSSGILWAGSELDKETARILARYGDDFGKMGVYIENPNIKIDWGQYAEHGIKRMRQRGMTRKMVDDIVENGKVLSQNNGSKFAYITRDGVAIVNKKGKIITAWGSTDFDSSMLKVIEKLFGEEVK